MKKKIILDEKRRTFIDGAVKSINAEARTIKAYASTNGWDRYGERFEANAFKDGMANYLKNPVILFAHDYTQAPIAKTIAHEFDEKGLILTMQFAETEKAKEVFALYEGGFMNAFSVGFRPLEVAFEERTPGEMGAVFKRAELLENSAVPVPANPEAVVIKGLGEKLLTLEGSDLHNLMKSAYDARQPIRTEDVADKADGAPTNLKEAVGYLLNLGKAIKESGKVQDDQTRQLLIQAVNLCRELVLGVGAQNLDGLDTQADRLREEDEALLKELEVLTEAAFKSGKATQKDFDELDKLAKFIEEKVIGAPEA